MIRTYTRILSGLFLFSLVLLGSQAKAAGQAQEWRFKVYLDDKWIGYHNFRLTPARGKKRDKGKGKKKAKGAKAEKAAPEDLAHAVMGLVGENVALICGGLGAAHQTGWTGLLANLVMRRYQKHVTPWSGLDQGATASPIDEIA